MLFAAAFVLAAAPSAASSWRARKRGERGFARRRPSLRSRARRAPASARAARAGGGLGLELVEPHGQARAAAASSRAEAALEELARWRSLRGGGAQVVELAAERGQAIALGRERERTPRRSAPEVRRAASRVASRWASSFSERARLFLEASALFEQPAGGGQPFQARQARRGWLVGFGLLGLAARESQAGARFRSARRRRAPGFP